VSPTTRQFEYDPGAGSATSGETMRRIIASAHFTNWLV
jgi:hypothetical protein